MTTDRSRREMLIATGTAGALALAGCATSADTGDTPTEQHHDEHGDHGTPTKTHHDHAGHSHGEVEGPKPAAEVRMITTDAGTHFDPHVVWIEEGGTVTWVNESGSHTATAYAPANDKPRRIPEDAASFDSGLLTEQGATSEHTFEASGVYDYYCVPHEKMGMVGSVIVGDPDAHGQPGLAEPQERLPEAAREKIHALNEQVNEALGHTHGESTATETGHHDDGHHDSTATEADHHHDESTATETDHHNSTETDHHHDG